MTPDSWDEYDPKLLYDLFVGNKKSHIIFEDTWKRSFLPISLNLILKHLRHEIAIGSYTIYYNGGKIPYAKWICIDVDSHERVPAEVRKEVRDEYDDKTAKLILNKLEKEFSKRVNLKLKEQHGAVVNYLYDNCIRLLGIPKQYIVVEDSVGGFHLWLFLKDYTTLEDVGKWVYVYRDKINEAYKEIIKDDEEFPEIYPKQYTVEHLAQGLGNGVRLPLGYNFNKKGGSKILRGDLNSVQKFDLHNLVKDVEVDVSELNGMRCRREVVEVYDEKLLPESLDFWEELPIRECFKWIMNGKTQCFGEHGHFMRMALVHECRHFKMPKDVIVDCFKNQYDFNEEITRAQIESIITTTNRKDGRYGCDKIKRIGYCHGCRDRI